MKIRRLDYDAPESQQHEREGLPLLEIEVTHQQNLATFIKTFVVLLTLLLVVVSAAYLIAPDSHAITDGLLSNAFWLAFAIGLGAQMIDGALGMAYGVTATTFLLGSGVPPAAASASVHLAEVFTTGFSGFSHWRFGNINKALFYRLVIPGMIGGVLGAYVVTSFDGNVIKPYISAYLLVMGLYILSKAFKTIKTRKEAPKHIAPLALTGGFVDSVGGGGWGPVVTTSLVGTGQDPRTTIGSVNAAEFFLSIAGATAFAVFGSVFSHWPLIAGLVVGGLFAAPLAAWLCHHLPTKSLLVVVGILISGLSAINLFKALI
ncbi:MAG: sulfite exporter TauE/SafE family protein [Moraxellaceae bacterium]|nr:sulfite exporter TauE/SafE family protein [Moraxellaceae bacterium]